LPLVRGAGPTPPDSATPATDTVRLLMSGTIDERRLAARGLAVTADTGSEIARALLQETDDSVLQALFTALIRCPNTTSVGVAIDLMRSDNARLRTGALDALRTMPDEVLPHMKDLLADTDTDVRILACELARSQPPATIADLLSLVLKKDGDGNVCGAAIEVLSDVAGPEQVTLLLECAARFPSDPFLRFSAQTAAHRISARNGAL
jgi:hypothetical protein